MPRWQGVCSRRGSSLSLSYHCRGLYCAKPRVSWSNIIVTLWIYIRDQITLADVVIATSSTCEVELRREEERWGQGRLWPFLVPRDDHVIEISAVASSVFQTASSSRRNSNPQPTSQDHPDYELAVIKRLVTSVWRLRKKKK